MICYIDYGMMGSIDRDTREDFADLVYGFARRDEFKTVQAIIKLGQYDEELDLRSLERDVADFMGQHLYKPLKDLEIGKLLQQEPVFLTRDVNYCAIAAS